MGNYASAALMTVFGHSGIEIKNKRREEEEKEKSVDLVIFTITIPEINY
jgi:hypothetical protein